MAYEIKKLPKGMVEISFDIPLEDIGMDLENAAKHLSEERPIDGFRPGKAPLDVVKARFGEMAVYEHALEHVVRRHYVKAVREEHLHAYGAPQINVTKLAPGNPVAFTATVAVIPHVEKLADFRAAKVASKPVKIEEKEVDVVIKELRKMQTKEALVEREAKAGDKIVVDMDLSQHGVAVEGGQARNHGIFLDDEYYIPGVKEQVLGLKAGDKKSFSLKFPKDHFQKNIAGQDVDFAVTVKGVYELQEPALDDEFAKKLGQESVEKLRALLRKNMEEDAANKERQRVEIELLEKLVDASAFGDIPDAVLNDEIDRMIVELKHDLAGRRVIYEDYLKNVGKTEADLKLEFSKQAMNRVKTAILIREIAEKEGVEATDAEVLEEIQKQMNEYSGDASAQERVRSEEYQDYMRTTLRNRKVIDLLGKQIAKE
jgi:trigger factor